MAVSLKKGQKVDLTKGNASLKHICIGLGWDPNQFDSGSEFDLDASAFMLAANGKCRVAEDFIYYGNKKHSSQCIEHMGDNLTGGGEGDDETIKVDLTKVPADIQKIDFTATIFEADQRGQNFGMVANSFIRIYNEDTGEELCRYDLGEDFSIETAIVFGEIYRRDNEWKFNAIGSGYNGGLAALCGNYGIEVKDD